jgi:acetoin utilization protein AcuB
MIIEPFINREFRPLSPADTVAKAIARMDAWQTATLPVVEPATGKLIGSVTLEQLTDVEDDQAPVSRLQLEQSLIIHPKHHVFEATRLLLMYETRVITVVDGSQTYIGILEKEKMLEVITGYLNITEQGSVITVEIASQDYTIAELVNLIEAEDARILGIAVSAPKSNTDPFLVSFKLSVRETSGISQSLRRHGYNILSESHSDLFHFDISDRADELMRYLDV